MHEAAAVGFDRAAGAYERGRPSYPAAAVAWLVDRTGLAPGSVVADLAAGTGKLTRLLVGTGARVIAVEPLSGMRRLLAELVPEAQAVEAAAEAVPLADGTVDAVTVAQAFHWFDGPAALAEIHRILRPGGWLVLVWNRRLLDDPVHGAITAILEPHRGSTPSYQREEAWRRHLDGSPLFRPSEERGFPNVQRLDEDGLVDRVLSTSFVAALDDERRAGVERSIRELARRHDGAVTLRYACAVELFERVRSGSAGPATP